LKILDDPHPVRIILTFFLPSHSRASHAEGPWVGGGRSSVRGACVWSAVGRDVISDQRVRCSGSGAQSCRRTGSGTLSLDQEHTAAGYAVVDMLPPSQRPAACRRCDCAPQHVDAGDFVGKRAPRRTCCGPGDSSTRADKHSVRLRSVLDVRRAAAENCGSAPEDAQRTSSSSVSAACGLNAVGSTGSRPSVARTCPVCVDYGAARSSPRGVSPCGALPETVL